MVDLAEIVRRPVALRDSQLPAAEAVPQKLRNPRSQDSIPPAQVTPVAMRGPLQSGGRVVDQSPKLGSDPATRYPHQLRWLGSRPV